MNDYLPIAEHGLIGDLHTVALVGTDGTIDWYCCPRFDSPSVFGAILDADARRPLPDRARRRGWTTKQLYFPDTNVLITRFLTPTASARSRTSCRSGSARDGAHRHRLVRRVRRGARARCASALEVDPRFDYGARRARGERPRARSDLPRRRSSRWRSRRDVPLERDGDGVRASSRFSAGESATFVLEHDRRRRTSRTRYTDDETRERVRGDGRASGGAGCRSRATPGAGARWCTARRSR